MPRFVKYTFSGRVVEIERYSSTEGGKRARRAPREDVTTEEMERLNEKNAQKRLERLINANFLEGDLFVTLTYPKNGGITLAEAQKKLSNFLRTLRRFRRSGGLEELKYISATESAGHIHHHVITNRMSWDDIKSLWPHGRVHISGLYPDEEREYGALAEYLLKETAGKKKEQRSSFRRWTSSRNLIKPIEIRERARPFNALRPPREVSGIEKGMKKYAGHRVMYWETRSSQMGDYQYVRLLKYDDKAKPLRPG